jgi:hypothetical protein
MVDPPHQQAEETADNERGGRVRCRAAGAVARHRSHPSINNHVAAMTAEAARLGIAVVDENRFPDTTSDFRSTLPPPKRRIPT